MPGGGQDSRSEMSTITMSLPLLLLRLLLLLRPQGCSSVRPGVTSPPSAAFPVPICPTADAATAGSGTGNGVDAAASAAGAAIAGCDVGAATGDEIVPLQIKDPSVILAGRFFRDADSCMACANHV